MVEQDRIDVLPTAKKEPIAQRKIYLKIVRGQQSWYNDRVSIARFNGLDIGLGNKLAFADESACEDTDDWFHIQILSEIHID